MNEFDGNNDVRFNWNYGDFSLYDENGNDLTHYSAEDYNKRKEDNITFKDELHIGDIIKTKYTGRTVMIKSIDYVIGSMHSDYLGVDVETKELVLLGKDDIGEMITESFNDIKTYN